MTVSPISVRRQARGVTGSLGAKWRRARFFYPQHITSVSSQLGLTSSNSSVGEWVNWFDIQAGNHGVINVARRPAVSAAVHGRPLAAFLTNDCVAWPIAASNFNRDTFGIYLDVQPTATAGTQVLWCIGQGTGGSDHRAIITYFSGTSWVIDCYINDANGRQFTVVNGAIAGARRRYGIEYDSTPAGDACLTVTIDGVIQSPSAANLGAGGSLGQLQACTGNILIGNFNDGAASSALTGNVGPNIIALTSKESGAAAGQILTPTSRQYLVAFEVP